ncbi:MAG TPA: hypothetical protein VEU33_06900 [Archangium sp.]|nr:hypothetical protein [Archangium sp.]
MPAPARKASTAGKKRSGRSRCGACLASGIESSLAPGMEAAHSRAHGFPADVYVTKGHAYVVSTIEGVKLGGLTVLDVSV